MRIQAENSKGKGNYSNVVQTVTALEPTKVHNVEMQTINYNQNSVVVKWEKPLDMKGN